MQQHWLALLLLGGVQAPAAETRANDAADLLITDVVIVSPHEPTLRPPVDVLVSNGRIAAIGELIAKHSGGEHTILAGAGRYLVPGLIDSHTHLDEVPGMTADHEREYPEVASQARQQIPRSYLYHGFTTVIDLNSRPGVIQRWNARSDAPRAFFCGAAPVFDGYPMSFMPKPARYRIMPYFLYDESRSGDFPAGAEPDRHTPEAIARRISADGGLCIKTHYEKGFGGRGDLPVPSAALIRRLVAAAHDRDLPVLLHANSQAAQAFGVDVGVDAFAHGMWTWSDRSMTELNADVRRVVEASIAQPVALQPTIQVLYGEQDIHNPDYLDDQRLRQVLPSCLLDWYRGEDGQWWRRRMLQIPAVSRLVRDGRWMELDAPPIARVSAVLRYFADSGGSLLFGSDTPSDPTFANPPGLNGRLEMERWVEAGVSLPALFAAATIDNARFFGLDREIGTIEVGKRADLLLLQENPLERLSAYDMIETVVVNGRPLRRSTLSALAD